MQCTLTSTQAMPPALHHNKAGKRFTQSGLGGMQVTCLQLSKHSMQKGARTCLSMAFTFRNWLRTLRSVTVANSSSTRRLLLGRSGIPAYSFSFAVLQNRGGSLLVLRL